MDFESYTASLAGQAISMNAKELEILEYLLQHEARPDPLSDPRCRLEGDGGDSFDRVIDVYIKELRKKLELDCIVTVRNVGYKLESHDQTEYLCKDLSDHLCPFSGLVILLHASVYFVFPSTYIESQRQTILKKSQALPRVSKARKKDH